MAKIKAVIWKIEERVTEYGTKQYDIVMETEKIPEIKLGTCEVIQ